MPRAKPFIVKEAKYVLLTYAQCPEDWDPMQILDMCSVHEAECIVARERHADGGLHYHVFVEFGEPFSTRRATAFDVGGRHPNIACVGKTPLIAWNYVCKEGDIVCGGAAPPVARGGVPRPRGGTDADWHYILDAEDEDNFFIRLRERCPKQLACNYPALRKYADWRFRRAPVEYTPPSGATFDMGNLQELGDWSRLYLDGGQSDEGERRVQLGR